MQGRIHASPASREDAMFFHNRSTLGAVIGALLALGGAPALAQKSYGPGVDDKEIKIGTSAPLSGPASSYSAAGKATEGFFKWLNEQGGINGRKVNFTLLDNAYSPPKAVEQSRRLVEEIEVLAEVGTVGTAPNAATEKYLNLKKVPQLFISAGGRRFNDPKNFPWTIPLYPDFETEGAVAAKYILATNPDAKIALLYENDDFGRDYVKGFKARLGAKVSQVVAETSYELTDPTIDSQMLNLKASGADTLVDQSAPKFTAQAIRKTHELLWQVTHIIGSSSSNIETALAPAGLDASKGLITTQFVKQPGDPAWADDKEVIQFTEFMKKYMTNASLHDYSALIGYIDANAIALVLQRCGDELTRDNLLKQATSLKGTRLPMFLPGIVLNTSPTDYAAFKSLRIAQFDGAKWVLIGDAVSAD
jgi:branched-chain amino acid transport system substrate-binding protein